MTIQELYERIDGDYEQAQKVMKMDKMIDRYIRKLKNSGVGEMLEAAASDMDGKALFDSAHSMKGVCSNLGLVKLAAEAEVITEEFRTGNTRKMSDEEVKAQVEKTLSMYRKTVEEIENYEASA